MSNEPTSRAYQELSEENSAYRARLATAENESRTLRRRIASMSETVMRCALDLESANKLQESGAHYVRMREASEEACKKLRAAVLAAT